jgi:hypothetical protein
MPVYDSKNAIYTVLRDAYKDLQVQYPEKISVKVTTSYPRTVQEIDTKALVTISRITNQEEYRFITDQIFSDEIKNNEQVSQKGALQTDIFEIAIWTLDAQYRDDLYLLTRQILFEKKNILTTKYQFVKWYRVGGGDQELDVAKLPRTVYRAVLTYLAMTRMSYSSTDDLVSAITVSTIVVSGGLN